MAKKFPLIAKLEKVEEIITDVGLTNCADSLIGGTHSLVRGKTMIAPCIFFRPRE